MEIITDDRAVEGEHFSVGVKHDTSDQKQKIRVRISINGNTLYDEECDDPPCYQMGLVVPQGSAGRILHIQAESTLGVISKRVKIVSTDAQSGAAAVI